MLKHNVKQFLVSLAKNTKGVASIKQLCKTSGITITEAQQLIDKIKVTSGMTIVLTPSGRLKSVNMSKINSECNSELYNRSTREAIFYEKAKIVKSVRDYDITEQSKFRQEFRDKSNNMGLYFLEYMCSLELIAEFYANLLLRSE